MGAFVLFRKELDINLVKEGKEVFHNKGFILATELSFGNWKAIVYKKQLVEVDNIRYFDKNILFATGTPVYCGCSYSESLDRIFEDLCKNQFNYSDMYGAFLLVFYDGESVRLIHDDMQQYPVFYSKDEMVISSSFLVCAKMYKNNLNLDTMACLEKFCTGMITGENTLFCEIRRLYGSSIKFKSGIELLTPSNISVKKSRKCFHLKAEAARQLEFLNESVKHIVSLAKEFGADIGLSGGFDSRLMYGILEKRLGNNLSVHTHKTKGAHEQEIVIAKQLADIYSKKLNLVPTFPLTNLKADEIDEALTKNLYLFDGYSDSHYGTFSSTYSKEYRAKVSNGHKVFFTGLSGEIYRNYRKISKPVFTKGYFETYVFYCHYPDAIKNKFLKKTLRFYIEQKAFDIMNLSKGLFMSPETVRRYNAIVRLPYKASCAAGAFNQLSFYDAPCTHKEVIAESMIADDVVGDDSNLEAFMIYYLNSEFWKIPITKKDSTKMGTNSLMVKFIKWGYSHLPLLLVRKRKLKNNITDLGNELRKHSKTIAVSYDYGKLLFKDVLDLDVMVNNKNSYQNTLYTCRTLYEFKDKIACH